MASQPVSKPQPSLDSICCLHPGLTEKYKALLGALPASKTNGHAPVAAQNALLMLEGVAEPTGDATTDSTAATSNLVDRIAAQLDRFIFIENRRIYRLIALWLIGTHLHDVFEFFPYLLIHSPEPGCGKTRVLECIDMLCWNSSGILTDPTSAVTFHTASLNTQLIDEVDTWRKDKDLSSVLNAGFQRGGVVKRMQKDGAGNYTDVAAYEVYGPKALAGISPLGTGNELLKAATRTRVLNFKIIKQKKEERRERMQKNARASFGALRSEVDRWAKSHRVAVERIYETGRFAYLDQYDDRTIDVIRPLAAILEVISPTNEARRDLLRVIPATRPGEKSDTSIDVLESLAAIAPADQPLIGSASELAARIKAIRSEVNESVVAAAIATTLHRYSVTTKSMRLGGREPRKRYEISLTKLRDLLDRYATHGPEPTAE